MKKYQTGQVMQTFYEILGNANMIAQTKAIISILFYSLLHLIVWENISIVLHRLHLVPSHLTCLMSCPIRSLAMFIINHPYYVYKNENNVFGQLYLTSAVELNPCDAFLSFHTPAINSTSYKSRKAFLSNDGKP